MSKSPSKFEEPVFPPRPADPYSVIELQIGVLRERGYPVGLQYFGWNQAADWILNRPHPPLMREMLKTYDNWVRPVVASEFVAYLGDLGMAGEGLDLPAIVKSNLSLHPGARLVQGVGRADPAGIREYTQIVQSNSNRSILQRVDVVPLLPGAFMAAYRRREQVGKINVLPELTPADEKMYYNNVADDVDPIEPNTLRELVGDYFDYLEIFSPQFVAFRNSSPPA